MHFPAYVPIKSNISNLLIQNETISAIAITESFGYDRVDLSSIRFVQVHVLSPNVLKIEPMI